MKMCFVGYNTNTYFLSPQLTYSELLIDLPLSEVNLDSKRRGIQMGDMRAQKTKNM